MDEAAIISLQNCIFCGNKEFKHFDTLEGWNIVICKKCGYIFTNPRPKKDILPLFYQNDYFKDARFKGKFYNNDGSVKKDKIEQTSIVRSVEKWFSKRGKLLEIGAANGDFVSEMNSRGWCSTGIEISKDAVAIAKEKHSINLFNGTLEEFNCNEKFDVICMFQTLEHVENPNFVLNKACELLALNGILLIEVPNINSFDLKISKTRKKQLYDLPVHLSHFSPRFLKKQLQLNGFKIIEIDRYYPDFIVRLFNRTKTNIKHNISTENEVSLNAHNNDLLRDNTNWKGALLKFISFIFPGWKFTIIARK